MVLDAQLERQFVGTLAFILPALMASAGLLPRMSFRVRLVIEGSWHRRNMSAISRAKDQYSVMLAPRLAARDALSLQAPRKRTTATATSAAETGKHLWLAKQNATHAVPSS